MVSGRICEIYLYSSGPCPCRTCRLLDSNEAHRASDQPSRTVLLGMRHADSNQQSFPILPLDTDDPQAFARSPLATLVPSDAADELASSYMGPGPWALDCELKMPGSCAQLHFTTKNKRSNISVTHNLKVVFRVERGDDKFVDAKTGKRKLFDIVVQTPVHVLSVSLFQSQFLTGMGVLKRDA